MRFVLFLSTSYDFIIFVNKEYEVQDKSKVDKV